MVQNNGMKPCSYCGRENEDKAVHCRECGMELHAPEASARLTGQSLFRQPSFFALVAAAAVLFQAAVRLGISDGEAEHMAAVIWLLGSFAVAIILVCFGLYLRKPTKQQPGRYS